jgi:flagellar protein FliS
MPVASSAQLNREYRRAQVAAARPTQLTVMLYDGAIRFLSLARERMLAGDLEGRHAYMLKGQNIVAALLGALDMERGGDVAANLQRLYLYMYEMLVEANLMDKPGPIEQVVAMLADLRESWAELDAREAEGSVPDASVHAA